MEAVAENGGAGRARTAIEAPEGGPGTSEGPGRAKALPRWMPPGGVGLRWRPVPVERPELIAWSDPRVKTYLVNLLDDPAGPFADVDGDARVMLKAIAHYRNPWTGECGPGWDRLGRSTSQKRRAVGYTLARLGTAPSRQSDKRLFEGYGLVWREKRWRGARRTSSLHGFTCKFLIQAGLLLPHECMGCSHMGASDAGTRVHPMHKNGRSIPSRSNRKGGEPGRRSRAGSPPPQRSQSPKDPPEGEDPTWTAFETLFHARRRARYGDDEGGTLRPERRPELAAALRALVDAAYAWAQARELPLTEDAVLAGLFGRLVELWLDWPGSTGVLRERRHPIGLLPGDLRTFAPRALAAWKRAVRPPKPPPAPDELPARTPLHDPAPQIATTAAPFAAAVVAATGGDASSTRERPAPRPAPPPPAPPSDLALAPELAPVLAKKAELQRRGLWPEDKAPPAPPPLLGGVLEQLRAQAPPAAHALRDRHASQATHGSRHARAAADAPPSVEGCGACNASAPCDACATRHALLHPEVSEAQRAARSSLPKPRQPASARAPRSDPPPVETGDASHGASDARAETLYEDLRREHPAAAEPPRAPVSEGAPVCSLDEARSRSATSEEGAPQGRPTHEAPALGGEPREERAGGGAGDGATHATKEPVASSDMAVAPPERAPERTPASDGEDATQATQGPATEPDVVEVEAELWYERRVEGNARAAWMADLEQERATRERSGPSPGRSWAPPGPIARAERRRARRAGEAGVVAPDEAGAAPSEEAEEPALPSGGLPQSRSGPVERYERRRRRRGPPGGLS
jgi:hypothetical protein